jgi:hypothetical protein
LPVDPRLPKLQTISHLIKDLHLAALRRAEAERAALLDRIATLQERPTPPTDLPPAVAVDVAMRYDRWADLRRREIEVALKRKAAECDTLKDRARVSVGRDEALNKLLQRT